MNHITRLAAILLPITFLIACGGGGGGGGSTPASMTRTTPTTGGLTTTNAEVVLTGVERSTTSSPSTSTASDVVEETPMAVRTSTNGSPPPSSLNTSTAVLMEIDGIIASGTDTLLVSDMVGVSTAGVSNHRVSCTNPTTCDETDIGGVTITVSTNNFTANELIREAMAVGEKTGVTLVVSLTVDTDGDINVAYGGLLEDSLFTINGFVTTDANDNIAGVLAGSSLGDATGSRPTGTGSATWNGIMVGARENTDSVDIIQGDATITANFTNMDVDVSFTNIQNLDTGSAVSGTIRWNDITVTATGTFATRANAVAGSRSIQGAFYGTNHSEVGGVFNDPATRIRGAFGATRISGSSAVLNGVDTSTDDSADDIVVETLAEVRMLTGGSEPTGLTTSTAVLAAADAIVDATGTDTLLVSDMLGASAAGVTDHRVSCTNPTTCDDVTVGRVGITISTANFTAAELTREAVAVMEKNGVTLFASLTEDEDGGVNIGYGGWLDDSLFALNGFVTTDANDNIAGVLAGFSLGDATGTMPTSGSATWNGIMVGGQENGDHIDIVQGDATVDIDSFTNPDVDVLFNNIQNLDTGRAVAGTISWDGIPVTATGTFQRVGATGSTGIEGTFYGADHAEVGGVFNHEGTNIRGAFGAARSSN